MKQIFYALTTILLMHSSFASAGQDRGGGEILPSTEQQILDAVEGNMLSSPYQSPINFYVSLVFEAARVNQLLNPESTNDSDLKKVLRALEAYSFDNNKGLEEFQKVKFVAKKECRDAKGELKDASTDNKMGSEICFSLTNLKRIPFGNLRDNLVILAMHELSHHVIGDWELGAIKLQNYIEKNKEVLLRGWTTFNIKDGGRIDLPIGGKTVSFKCQSSYSITLSGDSTSSILLTPGNKIGVPEFFAYQGEVKKDFHVSSVACLDGSPISCKAESDGLQFGSTKQKTTSLQEAQKLLLSYQKAKLCK